MPDMLAAGVRWFDDWFAIREVVPGFFAIGEPRFHQVNWNYLVVGQERALLFDTGPGVRDISVVARALTTLPLVTMPSHMHFDHTGNLHRFDEIAIAELPVLKAFERDGKLREPGSLFLGHYEGMKWTDVKVSHWWPPGHRIDLGGRSLHILHTPGHSPDHVALWDPDAEVLLAADLLYLGALYAQVPGSNLEAYLVSCERLLEHIGPQTKIFGAHGQADNAGRHDAPQLAKQDVEDVLTVLKFLKKTGDRPARVEINARMYMLIGAHAYEAWQQAARPI